MKHLLTFLFFTSALFSSTLEELTSYARENSTMIKQAKAGTTLSRLKVQESKASQYGELNIIADATHYNIEKTLAPLTPSAVAGGTPITTSNDIFSAGISYNLALFTGFAQTQQVQIDNIARQMADITLKLTTEQLVYNIRSLYLSVLTQEEILKAQKNYTKTLEKLSTMIQHEVTVGKKAQVDLLKSRSDYQASKTKETILATNIKTTKAALSALIGQDVKTLSPIMIEVLAPSYSLDALYQTSSTLQKIHVEDMSLLKAEKMVEKSKSVNLPQVNLTSYLGKNYGNDLQTDDWDNETLWQVGVTVKYNLLDFGKRDAGVQKAKIAKYQATLQKKQLLLDLKKLLIGAVGQIEQSYATYIGNSTQLTLSKKSQKIEKVRYESSVATLNDLLLAQSRYQLAQAKVIESKYSYQKSIYYLDYILEKGVKPSRLANGKALVR